MRRHCASESQDLANAALKCATLFDLDQGTERRVVLSPIQQLKEPVMDVFQIPFVALFTGMVSAFAIAMLYATITETMQK